MEEMKRVPVHERLKARRRELGLSHTELMWQVRQSAQELWDIEAYDDEIFTVTCLYEVKKLCGALGLDLLTIFEIPCAFCAGLPEIKDHCLPRCLLVRFRREALGMSAEELGDKVGFYEIEIKNIETYTAHLESWVMDNITELANILEIPLQVLLDVRCPVCGR